MSARARCWRSWSDATPGTRRGPLGPRASLRLDRRRRASSRAVPHARAPARRRRPLDVRPWRRPTPLRRRSAGASPPLATRVEHRPDQVDRHREHDGRVLVAADLAQRLQVAQLERHRVAADHVGRLGELRRRLELALGVDDLRAALALGLGLAGDRVLHPLGDLDVLDLDRRDLDPPRLGLGVDHLLERLVEPLALGQQRVEVGAAEHRAQRRLGDLQRRVVEVLDLR